MKMPNHVPTHPLPTITAPTSSPSHPIKIPPLILSMTHTPQKFLLMRHDLQYHAYEFILSRENLAYVLLDEFCDENERETILRLFLQQFFEMIRIGKRGGNIEGSVMGRDEMPSERYYFGGEDGWLVEEAPTSRRNHRSPSLSKRSSTWTHVESQHGDGTEEGSSMQSSRHTSTTMPATATSRRIPPIHIPTPSLSRDSLKMPSSKLQHLQQRDLNSDYAPNHLEEMHNHKYSEIARLMLHNVRMEPYWTSLPVEMDNVFEMDEFLRRNKRGNCLEDPEDESVRLALRFECENSCVFWLVFKPVYIDHTFLLKDLLNQVRVLEYEKFKMQQMVQEQTSRITLVQEENSVLAKRHEKLEHALQDVQRDNYELRVMMKELVERFDQDSLSTSKRGTGNRTRRNGRGSPNSHRTPMLLPFHGSSSADSSASQLSPTTALSSVPSARSITSMASTGYTTTPGRSEPNSFSPSTNSDTSPQKSWTHPASLFTVRAPTPPMESRRHFNQWDQNRKHPYVTISSDAKTVEYSLSAMASVLGNAVFSSGRHMWTIRFTSLGLKQDMLIGVAHPDHDLTRCLGDTDTSWALYIRNGSRGHKGIFKPFVRSAKVKPNSTLTCICDLDTGRLSFILNGDDLGCAFKNVRAPVSPCICFGEKNCSVTLE